MLRSFFNESFVAEFFLNAFDFFCQLVVKKAPEHVIEEERGKEKDYTAKREAVRQRIAELKG
jgi:hypothetical protein